MLEQELKKYVSVDRRNVKLSKEKIVER